MIVVDTNVLSELMRATPSAIVMRWMSNRSWAQLHTTAVTQAEILFGLAIMPDGQRRRSYFAAAERMFNEKFQDRVLPFDSKAAHIYADILAKRRAIGRPISQLDAQIAAIARCHDAAVATRNVADFDDCGVHLTNPWTE